MLLLPLLLLLLPAASLMRPPALLFSLMAKALLDVTAGSSVWTTLSISACKDASFAVSLMALCRCADASRWLCRYSGVRRQLASVLLVALLLGVLMGVLLSNWGLGVPSVATA